MKWLLEDYPPNCHKPWFFAIHPGLTLRVQDVNGTEILLHEFPAKSHGETGETVQNIPIFSHKSGLTGLMPPWCHKSSASGPGHVAMEISHWDGTNNGVFTWHSPIYITMFVDHRPKHILLYKYMHNTFTYTYTKYIYIYIYIPAKSTCAKFWPLSWEYEISAPCNKKNGSFREQEKRPWKIIPESCPSSFNPNCDSNATTVGACY